MSRRRVAIVGAGTMGRRHARVFASLPGRFELVGVSDVDPAAARALAASAGVPVLSERQAFARAEAVVLATPIATHARAARRALSAGLHVLVEKPVAEHAFEARALLDLAAQVGRVLAVGHSERFNPVVRALLAELRPLEPESVRALELRRVGPTSSAHARDQGALLNLAVHDFDLAAYLTGSPLILEHVAGSSERVPTHAHVRARTGSGALVQVHADQRAVDLGGPATRQRTLHVTTADAVFQGDLLQPSLLRVARPSGERRAIALGSEEPLLLQAAAFADAIEGRASAVASGAEGVLALLCAERAALRLSPPAGGAGRDVAAGT